MQLYDTETSVQIFSFHLGHKLKFSHSLAFLILKKCNHMIIHIYNSQFKRPPVRAYMPEDALKFEPKETLQFT